MMTPLAKMTGYGNQTRGTWLCSSGPTPLLFLGLGVTEGRSSANALLLMLTAPSPRRGRHRPQ